LLYEFQKILGFIKKWINKWGNTKGNWLWSRNFECYKTSYRQ